MGSCCDCERKESFIEFEDSGNVFEWTRMQLLLYVVNNDSNYRLFPGGLHAALTVVSYNTLLES